MNVIFNIYSEIVSKEFSRFPKGLCYENVKGFLAYRSFEVFYHKGNSLNNRRKIGRGVCFLLILGWNFRSKMYLWDS